MMNRPNMMRTLRKIRAKRFPSCKSVDDLDRLLTENEQVRDAFGKYRSEDFYRRTVYSNGSAASIFVLEQLVIKVAPGCELSSDGTFGILPLNFEQLYIVMITIDKKVNYFFVLKTVLIKIFFKYI